MMRVLYHRSSVSVRKDYDVELVLYMGGGADIRFSFLHNALAKPVRGRVLLSQNGFSFEVDDINTARDFVLLYKTLREVFADGEFDS